MLQAFRTVLGNRPIRIATLTMFLLGFTYGSVLPFQSLVGINQLGMTEQQFGALMFAAALVGTFGAVVIGQLSDQARNRKQAVLVTLAIGFIGFGLFWLFPSVLTFLLCFLVVFPVAGASASQLFAVIRAETTGQTPRKSASINSVVRAIYSASWIIVPGLVGAIVALTGRATDAFGIAAVAYLVCLMVYTLFGPTGGVAEPLATSRLAGLLQAFRMIMARPILARLGALALIGVVHPVNAALLPLIVTNQLGGTAAQVGLLAGLVAGLEVPFMLFGGYLSTRWPVRRVIALGGFCHVGYALAVGFAGSMPQIYALSLLNAAGAAILLSLHLSYLQNLMPDRPGLGTALYSVEGLMMRSMGAMIVAGVGLIFGYSGALMFSAVFGLAGALVILTLDRRAPNAGS
jgi:MFS family permease